MSDSWLQPLLAKRTPDAIRVIIDLVQAGLRNGECSANDVRDVEFDEPNIIGGAFKCLRAIGFVSTNEAIKSTKPHRHAGMILKWKLVDRSKAEQFLESQRHLIAAKAAESREIREELFDFTNHAGSVFVRDYQEPVAQ